MSKQFMIVAGFLALASTGATKCGEVPIIRDGGFDLWCEDSLCAWKVDKGDVAKAATWHEADVGVAFVGDDVAISQLSETQRRCITFSFIADIDPNVTVKLEADAFADGSVEYSERVLGTKFKKLEFNITFSHPPDGVRFHFTKKGSGNAVIAQIEASPATECGSNTVAVGLAPLGADCLLQTECSSGVCSPVTGTCSECSGNSCGEGKACIIDDPKLLIHEEYLSCQLPANRELGERCILDGDCQSGICDIVCSACNDDHPCPGNAVCAGDKLTPRLCRVADQKAASGEPCFVDADCTSNRCNGSERKTCPDGRPCGNTSDCPSSGSQAHGACVVVGVQGGSCQ